MSFHFFSPKHPYLFNGGDTRLTRILLEAARSLGPTAVTALWPGAPSTDSASFPVPVQTVPKRAARLVPMGIHSVSTGRSGVHCRFDTAELRAEVETSRADTIVAEHVYMAESVIAAGRSQDLLINAHVLESEVQKRSHLWPIRYVESRRTGRDERRCVSAANRVATFDAEDSATLAPFNRRMTTLQMSLPPGRAPSDERPATVLFLGDRSWRPNAEALEAMTALWPEIRAGAPRAEFLIVGGGPPPPTSLMSQSGVQLAGFVPDLDALWDQVRLLIAPILTGGGVRVKILEAAAHGLPVVGTKAALGSIPDYLPLSAVADSAELINECVELLTSRSLHVRRSSELYEANGERWTTGTVRDQISAWLTEGDAL